MNTKPVWPFPAPGQIKKKPSELDAVELKIKRNEEKRQLEERLKSLGEAPL